MINIVLQEGKLYEVVENNKHEIKCPIIKEITYMDYYNDYTKSAKIEIYKYGTTLKAIFWTSSEVDVYKFYFNSETNDEPKLLAENTPEYFSRITQWKGLYGFTKSELNFACFTIDPIYRAYCGAYIHNSNYDKIELTTNDEYSKLNVVAIY